MTRISGGSSDGLAGEPAPLELESGKRRSFLGALLALGSFFVGTLLSVPLVRFALFPLLRRTTELEASPVGALSEFSSLTEPIAKIIQIEQVDGWRKAVSEKTVYVTKDKNGRLSVLSSICPHLGCTVPWVTANSSALATELFIHQTEAVSAAHLFGGWIRLIQAFRMANCWCVSNISVNSLLTRKS